jgi:hypothetical protein
MTDPKKELNQAVQSAMLERIQPALARYREDGNVGELCEALGCAVPLPPGESTPSVLEQLKRHFGGKPSSQ